MLRVLGFYSLVAFTSGQELCDGYISPNLGGCRPFKTSKQYCNAVQLCGASLTCQNSRCEPIDACASVYNIGDATKDLFESIWSKTGISGDGHKLDSSMFASDARFEHVFLIYNNTVMNLPLPPGSEGVVLLVDGLQVLEAPQVVVMYPSQLLCATDPHFQVFISGIDDEGRSAAITMMMGLGVVEEEAGEATTRQATESDGRGKEMKIKSASSLLNPSSVAWGNNPTPKFELIQEEFVCEGEYTYYKFSTVEICARNCANTVYCTTFSADRDTGCRVVRTNNADQPCFGQTMVYNPASRIYEIEREGPAGTKCNLNSDECNCDLLWLVYDAEYAAWCCADGPSSFNNGKPTCP